MNRDILKQLCSGLAVNPLPENRGRTVGIPHAANKKLNLNSAERKVRTISPCMK